MDIITKIEAKERNLTRFYTGRPCIHGHVAERNVLSGNCLDCAYKRNKKYRDEGRRPSRAKPPEEHKRRGRRTEDAVYADSSYIDRLPPTDVVEIKEHKLQVNCHKCGGMFQPDQNQVAHRVAAYEGRQLGESNFYCSDLCRKSCETYQRKARWTTDTSDVAKARRCQKKYKKFIGEGLCERCGAENPELHHTILVSTDPLEAINPAGQMLLCNECHKSVHRTC